ncbi:hypothetical protein IH982_01385 [Patescibacteria group bacterium]|nr:hypothetical protein [Patescibacteria group bacterium]
MPKEEKNKKLVEILREIAYLEELQGTKHKPRAYQKAALALEELKESVGRIYRREGLSGVKKIRGIGVSIAQKIEEYIGTRKIAYRDELWRKTVLRQIVTYYFITKGVSLVELKRKAKAEKIVYGKYAKSARELLLLAGSLKKAESAIKKVAEWANSRKLDYTLDTVIKRWPELEQLKPKEAVKKAFFRGDPMIWDERKKKWFVVTPEGEWLEFAAEEKDIEWRIVP